jgi:hypothetical protein
MTMSNVRGAASRRVSFLVLMACLVVVPGATVEAQTPVYQIDLGSLNLGPMVPIPVRLEHGRRIGALAYIFGGWAVLVPNSPRSGLGGVVAVPGVCIEWIWFTPPPPPGHQWDSLQLGDGDGDGDTDLIAVSFTAPYPYLVVNLDVRQCR